MERKGYIDAMTDFERQNEELETKVKTLNSRNVELEARNLKLVGLVSRNIEFVEQMQTQLNSGSNPMGFEESRVTASEGDDDEDDYDDE